MIEQRLTHKLITYWQGIKGDKDIPNVESFNKYAIGADVWNNCFILKLTDKPKITYTVVSIGENLATVVGKAPTLIKYELGQRANQSLYKIMDKLPLLMSSSTPAPIIDEGIFNNEQGQTIKYRSCMMPFGLSKTHIDHCVVGISWNKF